MKKTIITIICFSLILQTGCYTFDSNINYPIDSLHTEEPVYIVLQDSTNLSLEKDDYFLSDGSIYYLKVKEGYFKNTIDTVKIPFENVQYFNKEKTDVLGTIAVSMLGAFIGFTVILGIYLAKDPIPSKVI